MLKWLHKVFFYRWGNYAAIYRYNYKLEEIKHMSINKDNNQSTLYGKSILISCGSSGK